MRSYNHLSFSTLADASDRYFCGGCIASAYAVQMMTPGRIIGFRCYGSTDGEQAIVRDTTPVYFASGDRVSVYVDRQEGTDTFVTVHLNGAAAGAFFYTWASADKRNQNWNATVLVEYT